MVGLHWVNLTADDVLIGALDPNYTSRLGCEPNKPGIHADIRVTPDDAGKVMIRIPSEVAPSSRDLEGLLDLDEIWEPRFDKDLNLIEARGLLHYHIQEMPGGCMYLEILAEECETDDPPAALMPIEELPDYEPVLDHGFVRLDGAMADDLSVVNAARVSFARRKEAVEASDEGLIGFLMRERHGTPFEHNTFRFHVRSPIFVAREWFRHRVGSFNEFSMRYARATDDFYVPALEDVRTQMGKPGAYTFEVVDTQLAEDTRERLEQVYQTAYAAYEQIIEAGIAREIARCVLPVGAYTEFFWTVNARSLMNFISLRSAQTAQREIRRYAEAVERFLEGKMPVTHAAFLANSRVAP